MPPDLVYSRAIADDEGVDNDLKILRKENLLLGAELRLAQKGASYLLLDPIMKKIYLKNKGIIIREFDIERIRYWREKGLSIEPIPLLKKKTFFYQKRKEIRPQEPKKEIDVADVTDFLGVEDMPYRYTLLFEKGITISVTAKPNKGLIYQLIGTIDSISKHIHHSTILIWNHLWKKNFTIGDLVMNKEDAQALFWALQEGTFIVILEGVSA